MTRLALLLATATLALSGVAGAETIPDENASCVGHANAQSGGNPGAHGAPDNFGPPGQGSTFPDEVQRFAQAKDADNTAC